MTIEDSSSIGSLVQTVVAVDADATPPNNRVRYKLVGRGKASIYFHVEPDTGAVRVRDDLRKETDSEYTVSMTIMLFDKTRINKNEFVLPNDYLNVKNCFILKLVILKF